jgi:hypothetical protein
MKAVMDAWLMSNTPLRTMLMSRAVGRDKEDPSRFRS